MANGRIELCVVFIVIKIEIGRLEDGDSPLQLIQQLETPIFLGRYLHGIYSLIGVF
jgi:hypothetical protein